MRVGLLYPARDPVSPYHWSGTPRGLHDGLSACGVEVVPIGERLPPGIRHFVAVLIRASGRHGTVVNRTPPRLWLRGWALARELAAAGELDAVVVMATEMYDLAAIRPQRIPVAVYYDATLLQMWRHLDSDTRQSGFPEREVMRWCERQAASSRAADVCCVSTAWAGRSLVDDYGADPERVHVVGIGHRPRRDINAAARDWSTPRFLFIGVDWARKNGDAVLRAFAEVRCDRPEATLDVVGGHPPLLLPGVTGHGFLPREDLHSQARLDELFAAATAFVLPSKFEPAGIAYLEAASAGLPVIATTEGGARELLGKGALSVNPSDQSALVAAMQSLTDPAFASAMGTEAALCATRSTWSHVAARILDALGLGMQEQKSEDAVL